MRAPRGLSREEAELWGRVARTVKPLVKAAKRPASEQLAGVKLDIGAPPAKAKPAPRSAFAMPRTAPLPKAPEPQKAAPRPLDRHGLDGSWERKLAKAEISPDFTLDLHGHSLEAAHSRLEHGLTQAVTLGARVVLVITGKPRPVEAADRGGRRGAIRAKLLDWLAHGSHAQRIAAVRGAHPRHGGAGAVYVVLKRPK